jgi:hypothetical protein
VVTSRRRFAAGSVRSSFVGAALARKLGFVVCGLCLSGLLTAPRTSVAKQGADAPLPSEFNPAVEGPSPALWNAGSRAVSCARSRGIKGRGDVLTLIDYSLPSTEPRLWVVDLTHHKVLFHELVAHGSGSGDNFAVRFSNLKDSRATSLGLYLTGDTYEGGKGYSMRLQGLDPGVNDAAVQRSIVVHGAWYVSPEQIQQYGRLGRSWGCPALSLAAARPVIDTIKGGSFLFAYAAENADSSPAACEATVEVH